MRPRIPCLHDEGADPGMPLPQYETEGAAGADVRANLPENGREAGVTLLPGERAIVPSGLRVEIPAGFEIQVRPRSGLAARHGVTLVNTPGTIDSDYRGPLGILMINLGQEPHTIAHGDRIAQLVLAPVLQADFTPAEGLSETARGSGGFGSTGRD